MNEIFEQTSKQKSKQTRKLWAVTTNRFTAHLSMENSNGTLYKKHGSIKQNSRDPPLLHENSDRAWFTF